MTPAANARARARYWANREKYREKLRAHYLKHKEEMSAQQSEYRRANADAVRERRRAYGKANPHVYFAHAVKRKCDRIRRTPTWLTAGHFEQIKAIYKASIDLSVRTGKKYHVDHAIPLRGKTVSGLHVPWNLQIIPATDNLRKSNRCL